MIVLDGIARFIGYFSMAALLVVFFIWAFDEIAAFAERAVENRQARRRRSDFRKWQREMDTHGRASAKRIHPATVAKQVRR